MKIENSFSQIKNTKPDTTINENVAVNPDNPPTSNNSLNYKNQVSKNKSDNDSDDLPHLLSNTYTYLSILIGLLTILIAFFTIYSSYLVRQSNKELKEEARNSISQMNDEIKRTVETANIILGVAKSVTESANAMLANLQSKTDIVEKDITRVELDIKKVENDMKEFENRMDKMKDAEIILNEMRNFIEDKYQPPEKLLNQCHTYSIDESKKVKDELEIKIVLLQKDIDLLKNSKA